MTDEKMYINIVHRVETEEALFESVRFQQEECHRLGLKTTLLIGYPAMKRADIVDYVREEGKREDVEIGISFHDISCKEIRELVQSRETAFYLLRREEKEAVVRLEFERFRELFGSYPESAAGYILDANTLKIMKASYPGVKAAITNCFEEGVKMFAGNCNGWMLFSDGGPWGAYYPSSDSHLVPARSEEDAIGIVGLPHLNRDMVLALTSRDDYFASHPLNIMRAKANDGASSPYQYHFFDQWVKQCRYNGYGYYNVFVSPGWITKGYQELFVEDYRDARRMYTDALEYYAANQKEERVSCVTMAEFADWFRQNIPAGREELNLWDEILCGSKRQNFWYADSYFRMTVDMNQGGTIIDLRPYAGRWDNNLGPDTKAGYNGNYPFLISSEHRNTEGCCEVEFAGAVVSNKDRRGKAGLERNEEGRPCLVVEPLELEAGGLSFVLTTSFLFLGEGRVVIRRRVSGLSDPSCKVRVREVFHGCWGTNQYPEDLSGIRLTVSEGNGEQELLYTCRGKELACPAPARVSASIPQVGTEVSLEAVRGVASGCVREGTLFDPGYTLCMEGMAGEGEELATCLKIGRG